MNRGTPGVSIRGSIFTRLYAGRTGEWDEVGGRGVRTGLEVYEVLVCLGELVVRVVEGVGLVPECGFADDVEGCFAHCANVSTSGLDKTGRNALHSYICNSLPAEGSASPLILSFKISTRLEVGV